MTEGTQTVTGDHNPQQTAGLTVSTFKAVRTVEKNIGNTYVPVRQQLRITTSTPLLD